MNLNNLRINFLGDSITEGVGAIDKEYAFVGLVGKYTGAICRNYGIGGTRIARQKNINTENLWDRDFNMRFSDMEDADVVFVFGGTNDYGHGDAPLGNPKDRDVYTFYGALHCLYSGLINKYPNGKIIIITPLHRMNENNLRGDGGKTQDGAPLKTYVDIIREVAEYYSLPILDLYSESGLQPNVPIIKERYMPDGLHPSNAGYEIIAKKIVEYLNGMFF